MEGSFGILEQQLTVDFEWRVPAALGWFQYGSSLFGLPF